MTSLSGKAKNEEICIKEIQAILSWICRFVISEDGMHLDWDFPTLNRYVTRSLTESYTQKKNMSDSLWLTENSK